MIRASEYISYSGYYLDNTEWLKRSNHTQINCVSQNYDKNSTKKKICIILRKYNWLFKLFILKIFIKTKDTIDFLYMIWLKIWCSFIINSLECNHLYPKSKSTSCHWNSNPENIYNLLCQGLIRTILICTFTYIPQSGYMFKK